MSRLIVIAMMLMLGVGVAQAGAAPREPGGDFALPDTRGGTFRLSEQRGRVVVLYFGFTQCPDVCPTGMTVLSEALERLGGRADGILPVFVSIDPERDTPDSLDQYVTFFHPSIVALLGTPKEVLNLARRYGATFRKVKSDGAMGYTVDHTASFYLIDARGQLVRVLPHGTPASAMVRAFERALGPAADGRRQ